jgi:hypothetical protein
MVSRARDELTAAPKGVCHGIRAPSFDEGGSVGSAAPEGLSLLLVLPALCLRYSPNRFNAHARYHVTRQRHRHTCPKSLENIKDNLFEVLESAMAKIFDLDLLRSSSSRRDCRPAALLNGSPSFQRCPQGPDNSSSFFDGSSDRATKRGEQDC